MTEATKPKVKILKLDAHRINNLELLARWDQIWTTVHELRKTLSRARISNQVITIEMMQEYEQARNAERQFFWDNFYQQDEDA